MVPPLDKAWIIGSWRIPESHIPIVVGVSSGILILLLTIALIVVWRCCHYPKHREKNYEMHKSNEEGNVPVITTPLTNNTQTSYPSVLIVTPPKQGSPLMVHSKLAKEEIACKSAANTPNSKRKVKEETKEQRHSCDDMSQVGKGCYVGFDLPDIPESLNSSSCASSSVLDQSLSKDNLWNENGFLSNNPEMKTRSLPAWVRNKGLRGMQGTAENNGAAQTKVTQQKGTSNAPATAGSRRHHVLRHDTAALIALSRTKNSTSNQDRVSLVSNEAVIVFDERTAL